MSHINALIDAGRDSACAALESAAKAKRELEEVYEADQRVCHLCRLLFVPNSTTNVLRRAGLGAPDLLPLESMKPSDWPHLPFAIVDDVPLSMTTGYMLAGVPEKADRYLAYCMSNGVFRTRPFPQPTFGSASNALNHVFSSQKWKALKWTDEGPGWHYHLSESTAKRTLWEQVENMAYPQGEVNGSRPMDSETIPTPAAADSRRSP